MYYHGLLLVLLSYTNLQEQESVHLHHPPRGTSCQEFLSRIWSNIHVLKILCALCCVLTLRFHWAKAIAIAISLSLFLFPQSDNNKLVSLKMGAEPIQNLVKSMSLWLCGNSPINNNNTNFLALSLSLCGNEALPLNVFSRYMT